MARFCMKIAGQTALVTGLFDSTPHHFRAYLTDEAPDFSIAVTEAALRFEQADADEEAAQDGFKRRKFPDPYLERAAIQRKFAEHLLRRDILLCHGSTVSVDGRAYLFTARSGTGKSTHTRLWREVFGERAKMVNDDKPFLALTGSGIYAHGSPWSGKHGLDSNLCVPLQGICLLERGAENRIRPASPEDFSGLLLGFRPCTPEQKEACDRLLDRLLAESVLWHMTCNPTADAALAAYEAMSAPPISNGAPK